MLAIRCAIRDHEFYKNVTQIGEVLGKNKQLGRVPQKFAIKKYRYLCYFQSTIALGSDCRAPV
jgi:hypothetical protein